MSESNIISIVAAIGDPSTKSTSSDDKMTEVEQDAAGLLSQQIWCWGQDILRPAGNWLIEFGFNRMPPPMDRQDCASVYTLTLSPGKRIVLRGFGLFFGDDAKGGVFLERYTFQPQFTNQSKLTLDSWSCQDIPALRKPEGSDRSICRLMTMELIEWIIGYEMQVSERLGIDYRRETLLSWNNGKRWFLPAEQMMSQWRKLSFAIGTNRL